MLLNSLSSLWQLARKKRRRLDDVCQERHPELSRSIIQSWITQGKVLVNSQVVLKAGTAVREDAAVEVTAEVPRYVCRGGLKLEAALAHFCVDVRGKRCLDAGLSTGGFADCLLQHGAAHVIGIDVGYGQVAERLRTDARVTVMDRTNVRYVTLGDLPRGELVDMATLDLSFISVLKVLPALCGLLKPDAQVVVLIKPQFEASRALVLPGGVVRDPEVHRQVIQSVTAGFEEAGFRSQGCIPSPIAGAASGNVEFLAVFLRGRCADENEPKEPSGIGAEE